VPYRGMMLDGNGAPIAYSVYGLERIFGEDADRAIRLMMQRSRPGGACGVIFREMPEGKPADEGFSGWSGMECRPDR
jgi:ATP-dependent Clp protease adapter protein ClpS